MQIKLEDHYALARTIVAPMAKMCGADVEDVMQDSMMYAYTRLDDYDPSKSEVSTFLGSLFRYAALRSMYNYRLIQIPEYVNQHLREFIMLQDMGYSDNDIISQMKIDRGMFEKLQSANRASHSQVRDNQDNDSGSTLESLIADNDISNAVDVKEQVEKLLTRCKSIERRILEYRYGLNGHQIMTLDQIGTLLEISKERVRQIENKTLLRLRQIPIVDSAA